MFVRSFVLEENDDNNNTSKVGRQTSTTLMDVFPGKATTDRKCVILLIIVINCTFAHVNGDSIGSDNSSIPKQQPRRQRPHQRRRGKIWVQLFNNTAFAGTPIYDNRYVDPVNIFNGGANGNSNGDLLNIFRIVQRDDNMDPRPNRHHLPHIKVKSWTSLRIQTMITPLSLTGYDSDSDDIDNDNDDDAFLWKFFLTADQGYARLWIDNHVMIDQWFNATSNGSNNNFTLNAGFKTTTTTTTTTTAQSKYEIPIPYIKRKKSSLIQLDVTVWQEVPTILELSCTHNSGSSSSHTDNNIDNWFTIDSNIPRSELQYQQQRRTAETGWNTWLSRDMLSHTLLPSGLTLSMQFRVVYNNSNGTERIIEQIAAPSCNLTEFPARHGLHSTRGEYTEIEELYLGDNETVFRVESSAPSLLDDSNGNGDRLVILLTPTKTTRTSLVTVAIRLKLPDDYLPRYCEEAKFDDDLNVIGVCPGFETIKVLGLNDNSPSSSRLPSTSTWTSFEATFDVDGLAILQAQLSTRVGDQTIIQAFPAGSEPLLLDDAVQHVQTSRNRLVQRISKANEHNETMAGLLSALGWNVIYTPYEGIITPVFRGSPWWLSKPHNYVLFEWDTYFASIMASYIDDIWVATNNIVRMTQALFYQGFVVGFWNGECGEFDKSKPPIGTMAVEVLIERNPDQIWVIELLLDHFLEWNQWWTRLRMPVPGLIAPGSNQFNANLSIFCDMNAPPLFAANCETGLDNSPIYDSATFLDDQYIVDHIDVGMISFFARDCDAIGRLAKLIGRDDVIFGQIETRGNLSKAMIEELFWNQDAGIYINKNWMTKHWIPRDAESGSFPVAPTSFYPWFYDSSQIDIHRVEDMVVRYLSNSSEFGVNNETAFGIPSISRSSSKFHEQNYWRGRIWGPMNFLVYLGLLRYSNGSDIVDQARIDLSIQSERTFLVEWSTYHRIMENCDAETGVGCNGKSANPFYHWGALNALIPLLEAGILQHEKDGHLFPDFDKDFDEAINNA